MRPDRERAAAVARRRPTRGAPSSAVPRPRRRAAGATTSSALGLRSPRGRPGRSRRSVAASAPREQVPDGRVRVARATAAAARTAARRRRASRAPRPATRTVGLRGLERRGGRCDPRRTGLGVGLPVGAWSWAIPPRRPAGRVSGRPASCIGVPAAAAVGWSPCGGRVTASTGVRNARQRYVGPVMDSSCAPRTRVRRGPGSARGSDRSAGRRRTSAPSARCAVPARSTSTSSSSAPGRPGCRRRTTCAASGWCRSAPTAGSTRPARSSCSTTPRAPGGAWQHRWAGLTMATCTACTSCPGKALVGARPGRSPPRTSCRTTSPSTRTQFGLHVQRPVRVRPRSRTAGARGRARRRTGLPVHTRAVRRADVRVVWRTARSSTRPGPGRSRSGRPTPGGRPFQGRQLHTRDYRHADDLAGRARRSSSAAGTSAVQLLLAARRRDDHDLGHAAAAGVASRTTSSPPSSGARPSRGSTSAPARGCRPRASWR